MSQGPERLPQSHPGRLKPGHKLIFPDPTALLSLVFKGERNEITDRFAVVTTKEGVDDTKLSEILNEYFSIYELLHSLVGSEGMLVARTSIVTLKQIDSGLFGYVEEHLPKKLQEELGSEPTPFLNLGASAWPRDAHSVIEDEVLTKRNAWTIQGKNIRTSGLGEGGKILVRNKTLFVTKDIWDSEKDELKKLKEDGFRIAYLPFVEPSKQEQSLNIDEGHIDCHASLIEDKEGGLVLIVAKSYAFQGKKTRKQLRETANHMRVQMIEVDDRLIPPLALNLLQFDDRSVAVTADPSSMLIDILSGILGKDKVFTTQVPLTRIPTIAGGGIRCLTNEIPPLDQSLLKTIPL